LLRAVLVGCLFGVISVFILRQCLSNIL
jgi:hypothetical protein